MYERTVGSGEYMGTGEVRGITNCARYRRRRFSYQVSKFEAPWKPRSRGEQYVMEEVGSK